MNIAFEAKRAFSNGTGLGNYSRTLIRSLALFFPDNNYYLYTPRQTARFNTEGLANVHTITPSSFPATFFKGAWRSRWVKNELTTRDIHLYHGLSHEIPFGIHRKGIPSVVTIHDLIFERYPNQFNWIDVQIYRQKFRYACHNANQVIAISQQTKSDITNFYNIPEEKITVCYQSCHPAFGVAVGDAEKQRIKKQYNLPGEFLLYVGSVIERKNLLLICESLNLLKHRLNIPLVVIGEGGRYKQQVQHYLQENNLADRVRFLSEEPSIKAIPSFRSAADFPAIYQQASCLIYPSSFEGFGIPVLEALWSRLPVIISNVSCLPETGGDAAHYVDPNSKEELAAAIVSVLENSQKRAEMVEKGWLHAQHFTQLKCAASVMNVYHSLF